MDDVFLASVSEGCRSAGRELPQDWLQIARIADLFAWAELLGRPKADDAMIEDACRVIEATVTG